MKITTLFTPLFLLIFVSGVVAPLPAMAEGTTQPTASTNWFTGLFSSSFVQFLAQKLGIEPAKVQSALNDYASQNKQVGMQNRQNREKSRLDNLVSQGKITLSQEQAILAELSTLHAKYNPANFKNLTLQERRQEFQQMRNELTTWAKDNSIDPNLILPYGGKGHRWRMGMHMRSTTPTSTPTQ